MRLIAAIVRMTRLDGISARRGSRNLCLTSAPPRKGGRVAAHPFNYSTFNRVTCNRVT
jgi:hypothetical protein